MNSIVIIQARINSSRLPGKVLLPIGGRPMVVLAAQRAANTGRYVIVATSNEDTDNVLAECLSHAGISCYRGSLDNTLQRVVDALEGYGDDALVFRLTADNVFPDGNLLDEMEREFLNLDLKYLCCNGEKSGLPYGMSAELTRARYLREAAETTQSQYDQEHVTPYLRRKFGDRYFEKYRHLNKGHFRCTVDCLDDYLTIQLVFSSIKAPERAPAFQLIERLTGQSYQPLLSESARKLVLGTVQLGLTYGISNQSGQPDKATSEKLIKTAIANGAKFIDTARAYGNSEEVIGSALKSGWEGRVQIITKLSPLLDCPNNATTSVVNAFVDASIFRSCMSLRTQKIDVLLLHRASHLWDWSGAVWQRLLDYRDNDKIKSLGVSIQNPKELEQALEMSDIEFIQIPFNVLDWRWDALIPKIIKTKQQRPLVIHARSALLQGLLPSKEPELWNKANLDTPASVIEWLEVHCRKLDRANVINFCLSFVKSTEWVDGVVVGMESHEQLAENIQIFCDTNLTQQQLQEIIGSRPILDERVLNPAYWRS